MANSHTLGTLFSPRMRWVDIEVPSSSVDKNSWELLACYPRRTFYPLSNSPSTWIRWITMTDFRLCSTCLPRSLKQAYAIVLYWRFPNVMSLPYAHLCYLLGGDRPSQTTRLAMFYFKNNMTVIRCYLKIEWCFIDNSNWAWTQLSSLYHLRCTINQIHINTRLQ